VIVGNMAYCSGHVSVRSDGTIISGCVGSEVDQDFGKKAAEGAGLAILTTLRHNLGSLDRVKRVVKTLGMVNCTADFHNHPEVINGCSELLLYGIRDRAEQRELLDQIVKAGKRSASLTRQLLAFSQQQVLAPDILDLNEVVHGAMLKGWRERERIEISEEYGDLPHVWSDAMLIESAMLTIVENAIDAMPGKGLLAVRTGVVDGYEKRVPFAIIEIADTGTGISEEFIQKELFAPFVTTKPRGLGLGLYTCQQIIQMHNGEIRVRSELGRGTVFSVYLPITD